MLLLSPVENRPLLPALQDHRLDLRGDLLRDQFRWHFGMDSDLAGQASDFGTFQELVLVEVEGRLERTHAVVQLRDEFCPFSAESGVVLHKLHERRLKLRRPLSAQAEAGNVKLVRGTWNRDFLDELCTFPSGTHDDQVDAASAAFNRLALVRKLKANIW